MNRRMHLPTLRLDPQKKVAIQYGGRSYQGIEGDTIATLLYANGIRIFGRSLKYHRPRGLYSLDGECGNTLMEVDGIPNVRTESTPAKDGMIVKAQNVIGKTAEWDPMGFLDKFSWAMPAGFYYRTLHKPAAVWPVAARWIRKAAGLGVLAPDFEMKGRYDEIYPKADVCVIGGGPAGMSAALAAAQTGLRVVLLENRPWLGGFFDYRPAVYNENGTLYERARVLAEQVQQVDNIRVFTHTAAVGAYNNNLITAVQRCGGAASFDQRYVEIRAESVVVATGCIERPLLFENNERPGVMQVGCAHRLARTWGVLPGESAVFSIGHDLGLEAAVDLNDLGLKVLCVADVRQDGQKEALLSELEKRNIPVLKGWAVVEALGRKTANRVTLAPLNGTGSRRFDCDVLAASAGLTPLTGLLTLAQGKLRYDDHTGFFLPDKLPRGVHAAGRLLGFDDAFSVEASGHRAGLCAAADCGASSRREIQTADDRLASLPGPVRGSAWVPVSAEGKKSFICFDEDATLKHVRQAMAMGFDVPEMIKRFTAAGTGPGQGGIAGHNLPLFVSQTGLSPAPDPKPTTVRSPLIPTYLAAYAGTRHDMSKRTPVHDSQLSAGGRMERIGVWNRARYFSEDRSCRLEVENVRNNVGVLDASTLGKFRIHGPDALKALERVYVGDMSKVSPGRIKYSAMCNEDGCLIDDGVIVERGENDYYLTASTGRAGETAEWFRYHTRYDGWNYHIVNLTDVFGVINLAGPRAREVLQAITDADVSNEAFPFTGYREFLLWSAVPARAMRLGFVGELSYELHVPSSYMQAVWDGIMDAGKGFGIRNFGLESQNILRLEKGHVIIGAESEQRTTLHDLGLGFLWHRHKPEAKTVGAAALRQTEEQKGRLKLVGFNMEDPSSPPPKDGSVIVDGTIRGYVCTARYSVSLKAVVGMALVEDSLAGVGSRLEIFEDDCNGNRLYAEVVKMPFYDPHGVRLRM